MKKLSKEKLIAIIGISILVIALVVAIVLLLVKNVGNTILKVESKNAIPGDEISIPITVEKNHGMYIGQIMVQYDSDSLEFLSCTNGEVFDQCTANSNDVEDTIVIIAEQTGLENTDIDGVVATLNFRVRKSAKKGTYPISLYVPETVEEGTYFVRVQDIDEQKWIVPKCIAGKIVVQ